MRHATGPLHVLHVIDGLGLGGAERMVIDIANRTVADGYRASVCVTRQNLTLAPELDRRVRLFPLDRRARISPLALMRLRRIIRRERIDVIHVHMRSNLAFVLQLRAPRLVTTPIVFHDHFGTIEIDTEIPTWFRIGHRYVDQYVGVYDKLCVWAQRAGISPARTITIPNAINLARLATANPSTIRRDLRIDDDKPLGLAVATLRRDKGIEVLLRAVSRSKTRHRMRVLIAGTDGEPTYAAECRALCTSLGLDSTITFLGGRTDIPELLPACDFALLSSHTESGPLVLVEYLAAGLPIVSTRVGDIGHRLAEAGVPGFVPPSDEAAFATALDELLESPPQQQRARGTAGRKAIDALFDIRAAMPKWYETYRAAIASSSSTVRR